MDIHAPTEIDQDAFRKVTERLRLHTPEGHEAFKKDVSDLHGNKTAELLRGLSFSNIKLMRSGKKGWPTTLPYGLVEMLQQGGNDVSFGQRLNLFSKLGFDIRLDCSCIDARNNENPNRFTLEDLRFEIHEANAVAEDPENADFEIELKVGFDRIRLTVLGDNLKTEGNFIACETPDSPEAKGISDAVGWFRMRFVSSDPLAWIFEPQQEGRLLSHSVTVEGKVAEVSTSGSRPTAIISALREALKVRVVDPVERRAPKALIDAHRDKMCAAVAQRSLGRGAPEYVLHSARL